MKKLIGFAVFFVGFASTGLWYYRWKLVLIYLYLHSRITCPSCWY